MAIPHRVLHTCKSLKTMRSCSQGIPHRYWGKSLHEIGLDEIENGIQVNMGVVLSCGRQGVDVFETQKKSVTTEMFVGLDRVGWTG